jgi:hypothetical protein
MDFDPDARERTFKVKIAAEVQPVPPTAIPGTPVRPVLLEGLTVTPLHQGRDPAQDRVLAARHRPRPPEARQRIDGAVRRGHAQPGA